MAPVGRPPKPVEVKRRNGNPGKRPLPAISSVTVLRAADGTPSPPVPLGDEGRRLWDRAWSDAITWLSPDSDLDQVTQAATLADAVASAHRRYMATTDPSDARALVALSKQFTEALSALGFNPVARSRLGVAEVKRASALEELVRARRQG